MQISTDFPRLEPQPAGAWGWADPGVGAARQALLPGAGQGAGAEAGCRVQAGAGPLTLDLQNLVAEVRLEVEGAIGWEH